MRQKQKQKHELSANCQKRNSYHHISHQWL